nr:retrovirus-related Pol polyprotein from transposon TNT 1-94 [Tanacetum cinerariifolium]
MAAGQKKPEAPTADERKAANPDQRLKSLIICVLLDNQMNSVINCLSAKSTWDDMIIYHEGPSDVKESRDFQDSPDDEEDTRSSLEYLKYLEEEYQAKALLGKSKRFFKKGTHSKPKMRNTKDFEAEYNKFKAKLAPFSSSASAPSSFPSKNKGLIAESYNWDEEEVSSDDKETKVKAPMALTDNERISIGKESTRNGEWTKITIKKCINEQITTQKKKIFRIGQLIEDTSSFGSKDLVFKKSLTDNSDMFITNSTLYNSSEAKDSTLPNHNIDELHSNISQRNITNPSSVVSDSQASASADESSVCSTLLLPLKNLDGVEPSFGPKTVNSILKSKSIFKAESLKGRLNMTYKLKYLKEKIQIWARLHKESLNSRKSILKAELADFDGVIDKGDGLDADGHRRQEVVRLIQEMEKVDAMEVAQKAKIK